MPKNIDLKVVKGFEVPFGLWNIFLVVIVIKMLVN